MGRDFPDNEALREANPEQVVHCAAPCLGYSPSQHRTINEMVGQVGALDTSKAVAHWRAQKLDLTPVLYEPESAFMKQDLYCTSSQDHGLDKALDQQLIAECRDAIESKVPVSLAMKITNVNRTVGTMLGHEVTKVHGGQGLPDGTIDITLSGSAGQGLPRLGSRK